MKTRPFGYAFLRWLTKSFYNNSRCWYSCAWCDVVCCVLSVSVCECMCVVQTEKRFATNESETDRCVGRNVSTWQGGVWCILLILLLLRHKHKIYSIHSCIASHNNCIAQRDSERRTTKRQWCTAVRRNRLSNQHRPTHNRCESTLQGSHNISRCHCA